MIVHRHRQRLLGLLLPDAMQIELALDLGRLRHAQPRKALPALRAEFLVENVLAENDAVVADVDPGPLDELAHFRVGFAAETAEGKLTRAVPCRCG
jgi:hypothetical protein